VLVVPFEVQVGGEAKLGPAFQDRPAGGAGVEPDVQDILFLGEVGGAAVGAREAWGEELRCVPGVPNVGCLAADELADVVYRLFG